LEVPGGNHALYYKATAIHMEIPVLFLSAEADFSLSFYMSTLPSRRPPLHPQKIIHPGSQRLLRKKPA
jgi:hypothetical protein